MKVSIRQQVFETNSSSVHSCSICTESDYKKFRKGDIWYNEGDDVYLPKDEAIKFNLNYVRKECDNMTDEEFARFSEVYKEKENFEEAFEAIDWDMGQEFDPYDIYMSHDDFWDYHEYEDWTHYFKDTARVKMVAWGYCGHD